MKESERIRADVHAAAARLHQATAELAKLSRRKEFVAELRAKGNWLASGHAPMPDWVKPWHDYFESLPKNPEYQRWTEEARLASEALDTEAMLERLRAGEADAVEWGIAFLEADPYAFRTGYTKAKIARYLRKATLSPEQSARLRAVVLTAIGRGSRFEFVEYARLARRLDSPEFRKDAEQLLKDAPHSVARRARTVLDSCVLNETRADLRGAR